MQNNNISISQDMNRIFDLKGESTNVIADFIQPIMNIQRFCNIVRNVSSDNATSATLYTTPSDKDFYLVSASLSFVKDITATTTGVSLRAVVEGVQRRILELACLTLTVERGQLNISLNNPIKIDRNTNISVDSITNNANFNIRGQIIGYTVETTK
jgi:hypothetical protein